MPSLQSYTASAWNVNTDQPVVIQIHLQGAGDYLDGPTPTVEVYQGTIISKKKFGLGGQIQKYCMQTYPFSSCILHAALQNNGHFS